MTEDTRSGGTRNSAALTWTCETCHFPVADGTGYLSVSLREAYDAACAWSRTNDGHLATWCPRHVACDFDEDPSAYKIDVERLRTHRDVLWWTAHLMGKIWLEHTDWPTVIRTALGDVA